MSKSYPEQLRLIGLLTGRVARQAISAMGLTPGSIGLDAGCGIGTHAIWLAEETGPCGEIIGVDISPVNLKHAQRTVDERGLSARVMFLREDIQHLPFSAKSFDYVWCADTLWPGSEIDPPAAITEFRRVVKPGGRIGLLFWATQILLPGYPLLEARLNLAHACTNPYLQNVSPSLHFLCANGWLRSAGLIEIGTNNFLAGIPAPSSREEREAIAYCMTMLWGNLEAHVSAKDWSLFQKLNDPQSSDCIFVHPDYHALIVYTLFQARVPVQGRSGDGNQDPSRGDRW